MAVKAIMNDMENFKKDLNTILKKYGYTVNTCAIDERHGRSTNLKPTIELVLDEIEKPRPFWID